MNDWYRDPIWELMDMFSPAFGERAKIQDTGLKGCIHRPHNLINVKDDSGKVIAQRVEVVTTPFKREDVKVTIKDNTLSVKCGAENIADEVDEDVIYRGISSQSYSFALKLGPSVDQSKITAENKDGVLKVNLPLIIEEKKEPEEIEIKID